MFKSMYGTHESREAMQNEAWEAASNAFTKQYSRLFIAAKTRVKFMQVMKERLSDVQMELTKIASDVSTWMKEYANEMSQAAIRESTWTDEPVQSLGFYMQGEWESNTDTTFTVVYPKFNVSVEYTYFRTSDKVFVQAPVGRVSNASVLMIGIGKNCKWYMNMNRTKLYVEYSHSRLIQRIQLPLSQSDIEALRNSYIHLEDDKKKIAMWVLEGSCV